MPSRREAHVQNISFACFLGISRNLPYIKIKPFKVPLMVATMIAKWVADAFDEHGIYDKHIILNNYPFLDCKTEYRYSTLACDVMRPRPEEPNSSFCVLTGEGMSIQEIDDILKRNSYNGFPGKNYDS